MNINSIGQSIYTYKPITPFKGRDKEYKSYTTEKTIWNIPNYGIGEILFEQCKRNEEEELKRLNAQYEAENKSKSEAENKQSDNDLFYESFDNNKPLWSITGTSIGDILFEESMEEKREEELRLINAENNAKYKPIYKRDYKFDPHLRYSTNKAKETYFKISSIYSGNPKTEVETIFHSGYKFDTPPVDKVKVIYSKNGVDIEYTDLKDDDFTSPVIIHLDTKGKDKDGKDLSKYIDIIEKAQTGYRYGYSKFMSSIPSEEYYKTIEILDNAIEENE